MFIAKNSQLSKKKHFEFFSCLASTGNILMTTKDKLAKCNSFRKL